MTKEEFNNIKPWDIIRNIQTKNMYIVSKTLNGGCEIFCYSGFIIWSPELDCLTNFEVTGSKYQPSYQMINHMIELYKKWETEKPDGMLPNMYIFKNWTK